MHEDYFVEMIIKLSHCRHSISYSDALNLINSLTKGAEIEEKLKDWKKKNSYVNDVNDVPGTV